MSAVTETAYIVFDTESAVDGNLVRKVRYPGQKLTPEKAIRKYEEELLESALKPPKDGRPFVPVTFHVPVAIAVARVDGDHRLLDVSCLDAPRFDSRSMVELFWKGVQTYTRAALVDFNGRGFDLPLLTLSAFRFGLSCPRYFDDRESYGFRNRFTSKHLDLQEWITEFGSHRMTGGLDALAKMLGKPGKSGVKGVEVQGMFERGELQEINDYCLHDVLDTYFVFLRTRVLMGRLSLEAEQERVAETRAWLEARSEQLPAVRSYLDVFGEWSPDPFTE
jgi:hypothetical protein